MRRPSLRRGHHPGGRHCSCRRARCRAAPARTPHHRPARAGRPPEASHRRPARPRRAGRAAGCRVCGRPSVRTCGRRGRADEQPAEHDLPVPHGARRTDPAIDVRRCRTRSPSGQFVVRGRRRCRHVEILASVSRRSGDLRCRGDDQGVGNGGAVPSRSSSSTISCSSGSEISPPMPNPHRSRADVVGWVTSPGAGGFQSSMS